MIPETVAAAVLNALNASTAPALSMLSRPRYLRELQAEQTSNGITVKVHKRGFSTYKRRWPLPTYPPPPADVEGIIKAFAAVGLPVREVTEHGTYIMILILMEEQNYVKRE